MRRIVFMIMFLCLGATVLATRDPGSAVSMDEYVRSHLRDYLLGNEELLAELDFLDLEDLVLASDDGPLGMQPCDEAAAVQPAAETLLFADMQRKKDGLLYDAYLSKGTLDAVLVCKCFLPYMVPEEINRALRDVRVFIAKVVQQKVCCSYASIGETFLDDILNSYGHIIKFIDSAWVDRSTHRVFVVEEGEFARNAYPLKEHWLIMERDYGWKLHSEKFYASAIDYLTIMIRAYLRLSCADEAQKKDLKDRWLWWLEKVTSKIIESPIFGGYYKENVEKYRGVCALWIDDFDAKWEHKRKASYGAFM